MFSNRPPAPGRPRSTRWFTFWHRPPTAPASDLLSSRLEVKPPALWGQAEPVWKSLWHWLRNEDVPEQVMTRLDMARDDFCFAMSDFNSLDADDLRYRARHARSLRELWHLRAELYHLIACRFNQHEADSRLAIVNQHFPVETTPGRAATSPDSHGHTHHV